MPQTAYPSSRSRAAVRRVVLVVLLTMCLPVVLGFSYGVRVPQQVRLGDGWMLAIRGQAVAVPVSSRIQPSFAGVRDTVVVYSLRRLGTRVGTMTVTKRSLSSGDTIVFATLSSPARELGMELEFSRAATRPVLHRFDAPPAQPEYDEHVGVDNTSGPVGYVEMIAPDGRTISVLASKQYEYRTLTKRYANGAKSTVRSLVGERAGFSLSRTRTGRVSVTVPLRANRASCDAYAVLTGSRIAADTDGEAAVEAIACKEWRWLDRLGAWSKGPWALDPFTKRGYVRSYTLMRSSRVLRLYERAPSRFARTMILSDMYSLVRSRSADGLWHTPFTNTWVQDTTGVVAGYIDTRHNEGNSLWLLEACDSLQVNDPAMLGAVRRISRVYANYLQRVRDKGAVIPAGNGFFYHDYYRGTVDNDGHVSLNHALGEMNYLLRMYQETGDARYRLLALGIRRAVRATSASWIAADGDLHYSMRTGGVFAGNDYQTVTLVDLEKSQELFEAVWGAREPSFDTLALSKLGYINRNLTVSAASSPAPSATGFESAPGAGDLDEPTAFESLEAPQLADARTGSVSAASVSQLPEAITLGSLDLETNRVDRYVVELTRGARLCVLLTGPARSDFSVRVRRVGDGGIAGDVVQVDTARVYPQRLLWTADVSGHYYVDVVTLVGEGQYRIRGLVHTPNSADRLPGTALAARSVSGAISYAGDSADFWSIQPTPGALAWARVSSPGLGVLLRVRDRNGRIVAAQHARQVSWDVPEPSAGPYSLEVCTTERGGSYSLFWSQRSRYRDDHLPGVSHASPVYGAIGWATDPHDVFTVQAHAGDRIWAELTRPTRSDCDVTLLGPSASTLQATPIATGRSAGERDTISALVPQTGTYALDVSCAEGSGAYTLKYRVIRPTADDRYPGITLTGGGAKGWLHRARDPRDIYRVRLRAGRRMTLRLSGASGTDYDLRLMAKTSTGVKGVRSSVKNRYPDAITYVSPVTRDYYVAIEAAEGSGAYQLTVRLD